MEFADLRRALASAFASVSPALQGVRHQISRGLLVLFVLTAAPGSANASDLLPRLQQGGHVLLLRHAHAPGFGDPPQFRLGDCATQRNLDDRGRAQATAIGDMLREQGVKAAGVYSSQWCRCLETANLLRLGTVTPLPALNSFFQNTQDRDSSLAALREFLARQQADAPLLVLVTHHVNIQALTGLPVGSGEGVVLQLQPGGTPRVLGRLDVLRSGAGAQPATDAAR